MNEQNQNTGAFLFKKCKKEIQGMSTMFMSMEQYEEAMEKQPEILLFVSEVKSTSDLVEFVRKDPVAKWVLVQGRMVDISVSIPVFIDGKNVEKHNEWL